MPEVRGLDELNALLAAFAGLPKEEEWLTEAGAILLNRTRSRFLAQEAPDGTQWEESFAAKNRAAEGRGGGTLFDTGTLFHSISLRTPRPGQRAIYTDVPYAKEHQEGIGQVQRVFLGFSDGDVRTIETLVTARVKEIT